MRTPDEMRLAQIGEFFDVTVEWLRRDHRVPEPDPKPEESMLSDEQANAEQQFEESPAGDAPFEPGPSSPDLFSYLYQNRMKAVYRVEVMVTGVSFVPCKPF